VRQVERILVPMQNDGILPERCQTLRASLSGQFNRRETKLEMLAGKDSRAGGACDQLGTEADTEYRPIPAQTFLNDLDFRVEERIGHSLANTNRPTHDDEKRRVDGFGNRERRVPAIDRVDVEARIDKRPIEGAQILV